MCGGDGGTIGSDLSTRGSRSRPVRNKLQPQHQLYVVRRGPGAGPLARRCIAIFLALAALVSVAHAQETESRQRSPQPLSITAIGPQNVGLGKVALKISGTGFVSGASVILGAKAVPTHFQGAKKLSARATIAPIPGDVYSVAVLNGDGKLSAPFPLVIGAKKPIVTYAAAFRFLEQASWVPTVA